MGKESGCSTRMLEQTTDRTMDGGALKSSKGPTQGKCLVHLLFYLFFSQRSFHLIV
jgi:hypothetical protein